jgi:hypothetical protein
MWKYVNAGSFLIDRGWQAERALELMEEARKLAEADRVRSLGDDNFSDDQLKGGDEQEAWQPHFGFNEHSDPAPLAPLYFLLSSQPASE